MKSLILIFVALTSTFAQAQFDYRPERPGREERPIRPVRPIRPERPIRPDPDHGYRLVLYSLGSLRTNKFITQSHVLSVPHRMDRVQRVELVGIRGSSEIESVEVMYGNGQSEELRELRGSLRDGERVIARIYDRYITEIRVVATSGLIGSRGQVQVNIGVLQ